MQRHWWAAPVAFVATMLAVPVNAGISIPDEPLTTAARVAPNILFILDDSGSMAWANMNSQDIDEITGPGGFSSTPDANGSTQGTNIDTDTNNSSSAMFMQNYVTNSLYYNPATTYTPWMGADGNRLTGGTSYTSAYSSNTYVTNSAAGTSSGTIDLSNNIQYFYVPKDPDQTGTAYLSNVSNYNRYQILTNGTVQRGEYGTIVKSGQQTVQVGGSNSKSGTLNDNNSDSYSLASVPNGATLDVLIENTSSGGKTRDLNYWVYDPYNNQVCSGRISKNRDETCTVPSTSAGVYKVYVQRNNGRTTTYTLSAQRYNTNSCDGGGTGYGWINCTAATPTGRSNADELTNFATWYSYSRTRTKAAKNGASEAFKSLGNKARVGFRTIHDRNNFDIPVNDGNDGRFVNNVDDPNTAADESTTTRSTWYNRLYAAQASSGTPLQNALDSAGSYFSSTSSNGAYGPQSGSDQYSCRQNFTILTTDGFWNTSTVDVGNKDNTTGSTITGPKGQSYQYTPSNPYKDSYSPTLADIAMKYWVTDLRTQSYMTNNVPTTDSDPGFWQHMVTFGISISLKGNKGWKSTSDVPATPNWADPTDREDADRIDDLLHAAVNGHGAFVSAASPDSFTRGLSAALATIAQRTSSYSNVATNAASLRTGGKVFNASYVSGIWTGAVKAWNLDSAGVPSTQAWTASIPAWGSRKVYTFNGSGTTFPTSAQIASLTRTGGPVEYPVSGANNANYIKGDQSKEGANVGDLRIRSTVLGDIVGSAPAYVDDTATLYVGSNDGMMHAFDATNGQEQFAYLPGLVNISDLAKLSRGDYTHKFFVDGPIVVSDRKLTPGKNLLVGAMGKGGKGLYGLDVSSPSSFSTTNVKWELAETSGNNMGYVLGRPILAKVKTGVNAAVLGNGINSTNNKAVLLVVNLETGAVIREINTGVGSASLPNGLSAPTGVVGPDGKTLAYAYAGDLQGNVWKFDLTSSTPGSWTATKLFTAVSDVTGQVQPITGGVTVGFDPKTYKRWVLFGTGRFLTLTDADDKTPLAQSMYGFVDSGASVSMSDLQKRTIINTGATQDGYPVRSFEAKADLPTNKKGWFVNLPANGERIVQDAQLVSNILVTASMVPDGNACESSGTGYINAVDAFTGTSAGKSFFDLNGDGNTGDSTIGGVPVGSVNFGVGMPTLPIFLDGRLIVGGTGGDNGGGEKPGNGGIVTKTWSRVSWREIKGD